MTTDEINERDAAREHYIALLERWCRLRDEDADRALVGLPWVTTSSRATFALKPEVRSFF